MALEKLTEDVEIIQTLGIYPNEENGLSGQELQEKFDQGAKILKNYLNDNVVPAHNQLLQAVGDNKVDSDTKIGNVADRLETAFVYINQNDERISDNSTQIQALGNRATAQETKNVAQDEQLGLRSQGRSAKYNFTSPGWKRVLNIIRTSGGMVNFGIAQSNPLYMSQAAGICFSGFVKYGNDSSTDKKPVLYQMYNNIFGENDAMQNPGRITAVRIGYPDPNQNNYDNGTYDAIINPVNCYMDIYVDYVPGSVESGTLAFNMNYAGFADSHNCEAITEETDAVSVGIYGEKLLYHVFELKNGEGLYVPNGMAYLPGFVKAGDGNNILNIPGLKSDKADYGSYGFMLNSKGVNILLSMASNADIDSRTSTYKPIVPNNLEYAVKSVGDQRYVRSIEGKTPDKNGNVQVIDDTKIGADLWSSKNIVDKLCQPFTQTGSEVTCQPVEGYPLGVVTQILSAQEGEGDPSPDNIRPIAGESSVNLWHGENNYTMDLGQTVYRGSLDWQTGVLTVTWRILSLNGQENWTTYGVNQNADGITGFTMALEGADKCEANTGSSIKCSHTKTSGGAYLGKGIGVYVRSSGGAVEFAVSSDSLENISSGTAAIASFKNWLAAQASANTPVQICYPLATPFTVQLEPKEILALSGVNTLYADTGEITVTGRTDPNAVIEKLTNAIIALGGNV